MGKVDRRVDERIEGVDKGTGAERGTDIQEPPNKYPLSQKDLQYREDGVIDSQIFN